MGVPLTGLEARPGTATVDCAWNDRSGHPVAWIYVGTSDSLRSVTQPRRRRATSGSGEMPTLKGASPH
jgi:hypothetical protein